MMQARYQSSLAKHGCVLIRSAMQEAAANAKLLTPALLQSLYIQAIANNTKLYFGDKLPSMMLDAQ